MNERRVLVVAGAGASRSLGAAGNPMPLMTDWAASLRAAINEREPGAADVIGLTDGLAGDAFEARLGDFLYFQDAIPRVDLLRRLGAANAQDEHPYFPDWYNHASRRTAAILEIIRENLFESFGRPSLDLAAAKAAYQWLRTRLVVDGEPGMIWFATTNYDPAIEITFEELGFTVLDGFSTPGYSTPVLQPRGLAERALASNSHLPVIHLHGAVGWYAKNGVINRFPADLGYNATLGVPALLLPDNTKTTSSLVGAETLWDEFRALLDEATHVLVLGHSLHDRHLVEVLAQPRRARIAVSQYFESADALSEDGIDQMQLELQAQLPTATAIPMVFGPKSVVHEDRFARWLHGEVS